MAATGRDVPLVQLTGRDRRRSVRGPRRSGHGLGHGSIPAAGRSGRARHCVCGSGVRVDTWGSAGGRHPGGTREPPARGRCERGVGARASLLPGRSGLPAPEAFRGGTGGGASRPRRPGRARHRVPLRARRARRTGRSGSGGSGGSGSPGGLGGPGGRARRRPPVRPSVRQSARPSVRPSAVASPPVSSPVRAPCQCFVRTFGRQSERHAPGGRPPGRGEHRRPPKSTRHARTPAYAFAASLSQRRPSRHGCHAHAGLPSHPGTAPDRPSPDVVLSAQAW